MSVRSFAAAALVIALAGPAVAQPPDRPRRDRTPQAETTSSRLLAPFRAVVAKANESTVRVLSDGKEVALGTVVFADGYVLTKASELRGEVTVRFADGASEAAKVVGAHQKTDLALLKVEKKGLVPLAFGDSKVAVIGNWLAAAGIGSDPAAVGIVSVATRTFGDKEKLEEKMTGRHLNAKRGYLGIQMGDRSPTDGGVQVDVVSKGGAAEKAGLKAKDVIYEVNGKAVTDPSALVDMLNDMRPGQKLTLGVRRKGEELQLPATLAGPPAGFSNRADIQNTMGGPLSPGGRGVHLAGGSGRDLRAARRDHPPAAGRPPRRPLPAAGPGDFGARTRPPGAGGRRAGGQAAAPDPPGAVSRASGMNRTRPRAARRGVASFGTTRDWDRGAEHPASVAGGVPFPPWDWQPDSYSARDG